MALNPFISGGVLLLAGSGYWLYASEPLYPKIREPKATQATDQTRQMSPTQNVQAPLQAKPVTKTKNRDQSEELLDNWNLEGTELTRKILAPFFAESQPESIVLMTQDGMQKIYPAKYESGDKQSKQTLYLGTEESIQQTKAERAERAGRGGGGSQRDKDLKKLPVNAYEIEFFKAGKRDNGEKLKPVVTDLLAALQGPDYSMENYNPKDTEVALRHLATVLSVGHSGELRLKVTRNGLLLDEPGFDFAIFQTTFRIAGTKFSWHKFAKVGVSDREEESSFKWFECDPDRKILRGCAGAVPTPEGGDQFDLSEVGLKQVSYIWIKDLGNNKNKTSDWPTEGISVDALRLDHAYTRN